MPSPASAAVLDEPAFTSVTVLDTTVKNGTNVRIDFAGTVPASANAGDTTSLEMPSVLLASGGTIQLKASDGSIVGSARPSADRKTLVVTYTSYVDSHMGVSFTGFFTATATDPTADPTPGTTRDLVFTDNGRSFEDTLVIVRDTNLPRPDFVYTMGIWNKPDRGTVTMEDAIQWRFEAPHNDGSDHKLNFYQSDLSIPNPLPAGDGHPVPATSNPVSTVNCDSLEFYEYTSPDHITNWTDFDAVKTVLPASEYTVTGCGEDNDGMVSVTFKSAPKSNTFYGAMVKADVHDTGTTLNFSSGVEELQDPNPSYSIWNGLLPRTIGGGSGGGTVIVSPVAPELAAAEACGIEATVSKPDVEGVNYDVDRVGDVVNVVATPEAGFVFAADATTAWTFTIPVVVPCDTAVTPADPTLGGEPACGIEQGIVIPDTEGVIYDQDRQGDKVTVSATAKDGYVLADGATAEWTLTIPQIVECPTAVTPVAPTMGAAPDCGVEQTLVIPDVEGVSYSQNRVDNVVTVTATANEGFEFSEGATTEWTLTIPEIAACDTVITPVVPTLGEAPACGVEQGVVVPQMEGLTYEQTRDGDAVTVTATAKDGFVLADDSTAEWELTIPAIVDCPSTASPVLPKITQAVCGADSGEILKPTIGLATTEGISYTTDVAPTNGGTVVVTATADDGFVLEAADGWKLADDQLSATTAVAFDKVECALVTPEDPKPTDDAVVSGLDHLARTGIDGPNMLLVIGVGSLALLSGAVLMVRSRRKTTQREN